VQDRRDDPTDSRKGIYNTLDTAFATNFFGSKTTFSRALGRNSTYHRITKDLVLARSTSFGVETKLGRLDVPLPERFFAGGASSHRGFPDNQAGPRDLITGFPIGGTALLINSVELRFPLIGDNIKGVLFHDAGNVYSQLGKISFRYNQRDITDFNYMVHALGFGVRYRTPVGPIRLDLAYALNPPQFSGFKGSRDQLYGDPAGLPALITRQQLSHFQFHFSLGQAF
jgi:outer membrane protein assembly factor BamA